MTITITIPTIIVNVIIGQICQWLGATGMCRYKDEACASRIDNALHETGAKKKGGWMGWGGGWRDGGQGSEVGEGNKRAWIERKGNSVFKLAVSHNSTTSKSLQLL